MRTSAIALLCLATLSSPAYPEERVALLIGNTAYAAGVGTLTNPTNDVRLLKAALKQIGFQVTVVENATFADTHKALNRYVRTLRGISGGTVGFFYYSGHGGAEAASKRNYLIPVDVRSTTEETELWDNSVALEAITSKLAEETPSSTHFVVFDACRNELTIKSKGMKAIDRKKGFQPMREQQGMLIAYATAAGEIASDAGAGAGHYAKALARELVKPGVEAVAMFRAVQLEIAHGGKQAPWLSSLALPEIYLAGRTGAVPPEPLVPAQEVEERRPSSQERDALGEQLLDLLGNQPSKQPDIWRSAVPRARGLIEAGASLGLRDSRGWTALMIVADTGPVDIARLLLAAGAEINAANHMGATALHIAAYNGQAGVARMLIEAGAVVDIGDTNGNTPLMYAAGRGASQVVRLLIENGAKVNLVGEGRATPLIWASEAGSADTVRLLLEAGADFRWQSHEGTALEVAKRRNNNLVVRQLEDIGAK